MSDAPARIVLVAIRESPRAPGRYQLRLSDNRRFTVGAATIADLQLSRTGVVLDSLTVQRLERESAVSALVTRAIGMLARARRTRRELELRLQRLEPDRSLVTDAIARLDAQGLLSDADVARAEASARLRRGDGPARVRQELRRKGVDDRMTSAAISTAMEEDAFDELASCRRIAEKRMKSLSKLDPAVASRRLMGFLLRRGYGGQTIREVVAELIPRSSH